MSEIQNKDAVVAKFSKEAGDPAIGFISDADAREAMDLLYADLVRVNAKAGITGPTGESAFTSWVKQGNTGSTADFIESLNIYQWWAKYSGLPTGDTSAQTFFDTLQGERGLQFLRAIQGLQGL